MEEVKGAMEAAATTQIVVVEVTMEAVMAADMVLEAEETIKDLVAILKMSQFNTQSMQLKKTIAPKV